MRLCATRHKMRFGRPDAQFRLAYGALRALVWAMPSRRTTGRAVTLLAGALVAAAPHARGENCPPAPAQPSVLPHTRAALATNQPVVVVALGSSSTQGWMATDVAHSYPALLQGQLNATLPKADFAVINRGIGGQDAPEELPRIYADVIAARPQLVIWQVGANGAIKAAAPEVFRQLVEAGVMLLKTAGEDVILMDNQRSPRVMAAPDHDKMDQVLASIAQEMHVGLFSRGKLMDAWRQNGVGYEEFVSSDGLHMNDRGYACVAQALAASIEIGVRGGQATASAAP